MSFLRLLQVLILGNRNVPKHDLRKRKTTSDAMKSLNSFIERNFPIICLASILFLLIVFVIVCYALVGVSAVESGAMRNFVNGGQI